MAIILQSPGRGCQSPYRSAGFLGPPAVTLADHWQVPQQRLHADHIAALVRQAQVHLEASRQRQEADANARRSHLVLTPGQDVMLKTTNLNLFHWPSKKLFPLWIGPFEVLRVVSPVSYELALPRHWHIHDVFHVNLLKPYRCNGQQHPPSPFTYLAGQPYEYEVERILDHWPPATSIQRGLSSKVLKGMKFLVRWRHATSQDDSWEPYSNLKHAPESLVCGLWVCKVQHCCTSVEESCPEKAAHPAVSQMHCSRTDIGSSERPLIILQPQSWLWHTTLSCYFSYFPLQANWSNLVTGCAAFGSNQLRQTLSVYSWAHCVT